LADFPDEKRKREAREPHDPFGLGGFPFAFGDLDREFERMRHMMDRMLREMTDQMGKVGRLPDKQPFVYGFSLRVGPDGRPQFQEFGDTKLTKFHTAPDVGDAREPLADVIEHDKSVSITVEIPGVPKEDIRLQVTPDRAIVRVDAGRKYFKEIHLPCRVVPTTADATFNNGVLDITIEREEPKKDEGTPVRVK